MARRVDPELLQTAPTGTPASAAAATSERLEPESTGFYSCVPRFFVGRQWGLAQPSLCSVQFSSHCPLHHHRRGNRGKMFSGLGFWRARIKRKGDLVGILGVGTVAFVDTDLSALRASGSDVPLYPVGRYIHPSNGENQTCNLWIHRFM
jgi:hypothetical protein